MPQAIFCADRTFSELRDQQLQAELKTREKNIEREYWGLAERHELLIAGRSAQSELPLEVGTAALLAEPSLQCGVSIVLDLSEHSQTGETEILLLYITHPWGVAGSCVSVNPNIIRLFREVDETGPHRPGEILLKKLGTGHACGASGSLLFQTLAFSAA